MATTDPRGSADGATERTIALTPDQAGYVAALLFEQTGFAVDKAGAHVDDFERREQFSAIRRALDQGEVALKQIEYGEPANGVTLTLSADRLWYFAHQLMADGSDGITRIMEDDDHEATARHKRVRLRQVEAGIAIVDQLKAAR